MLERMRTWLPASEPSSDIRARDAVLGAALILFSHFGYDQVTVEKVAREAGLAESFVWDLFGTKEELFAVVVKAALADTIGTGDDIETLGRRVVDAVLPGRPTREAGNPAILILRGAGNALAAPILRRCIERHFEELMAIAPKGADDSQRAALLFAVLFGFQVAWKVMGDDMLSTADPAILQRHLVLLLQTLIDPLETDEARP
ncbi:MAG TPA: TetR family transcriptional regulator [Aliidongia sp.]|nr:TetR family transcriptional regulator [Aliidongia sp.]